CGKAVTRNLVRRRLKEVLRELAPDGEVLVWANPPAPTATFSALRHELGDHLARTVSPATLDSSD
ncbi:MAG: ribonuclease P protein component, partial [Candidatus Latescibacteria bacterium]|nr:ribonuclease P protein component [Candidatus Latescibacterota bacterium]